MSMMNRLGNSQNPYQGKFKKVLCVCSAGLLRSPTAAFVLSQEPYNYNTRAAGLSEEYALVVVDDVLIHWADEIVCMTKSQEIDLKDRVKGKKLVCLEVPDTFCYRDPKLVEMIKESYDKFSKEVPKKEKKVKKEKK